MRAEGGRHVALSPALEDLILWDLRTSAVVGELSGRGAEVGVVCLSGDGHVLASGLEDGSIVLWDMETRAIMVTFNGHRSAVTSLHFNSSHTQLVSGSKDTSVIVWDIVSEAGLFRLKGHKGPITECRFMAAENILITGSRDGLVKLWDVSTQHCFQTLVSHQREVWSVETVGRDDNSQRVVVASGHAEIKVYKVSVEDTNHGKVPVVAEEMGTLKHSSNGRVTLVRADASRQYLASVCQQSGVEVFCLRTASELQQILKKRKRKASKKNSTEAENVTLSVDDEFKLLCCICGAGRHRWVDLIARSSGELLVLLTQHNNALALYSVVAGSTQQLCAVTAPGHRTDVRTLSFSSDNSRILSASAKQMKIWTRSTQQCVCTVTSRYALSSTFVPGDRYAIIGTKCGRLQLFDLSSNSLLEEIPAHEGAVWGVSLFPDKRGVATGSADHTVKFWEFELVSADDSKQKGKRLALSLTRTLKLSEDVLGVVHSCNGRLVAVALLDSTIKVFFNDTLKFFLSLYGHKLPVLAMDISSDSSLLVSSSADKNIRIWGLDFGDCHKAVFAHQDSIMCVRFIPDTHMLFSASKDGSIKCWDADNFQHLQTLKGHHGEVWCLAVSSDGDTVVSGSHDMSIRLWQRTLEPLVLSEQKELEREAFMDQLSAPDTAEHVIPGETSGDVSLPLTKSKDNISVVDRLLEALSIWKEDREKLMEHRSLCATAGKELAAPKPHPMLIAKGDIQAEKFVLDVVKGIRSSELEECLLVMPFDQMVEFLQLTDYWLERGWEVELTCRCLFFLLRVHHLQLMSSHPLLPTLLSLSQHTSTQITGLKDMYGFNLAGLQFLRRELESKGTRVFEEAPTLVRKKRKKTS